MTPEKGVVIKVVGTPWLADRKPRRLYLEIPSFACRVPMLSRPVTRGPSRSSVAYPCLRAFSQKSEGLFRALEAGRAGEPVATEVIEGASSRKYPTERFEGSGEEVGASVVSSR